MGAAAHRPGVFPAALAARSLAVRPVFAAALAAHRPGVFPAALAARRAGRPAALAARPALP